MPNENTPIRKNLIALTPSKRTSSSTSTTVTHSASSALIHSSSTSHLVLTNPKTPASQTRTDLNSLPEILKKDKSQITNSFSFESNLNMMNDIKSPPSNTPTIAKTNLNNNTTNVNSPRVKASPNLQKYYSFQKPSYSFSDTKCNCFNMPFVCEICTSRLAKRFYSHIFKLMLLMNPNLGVQNGRQEREQLVSERLKFFLDPLTKRLVCYSIRFNVF